jgi:hypothetical protein
MIITESLSLAVRRCPVRNLMIYAMSACMTKPEFVKRIQTSERIFRRSLITGVAVMGVCMMAAATMDSLKEHGVLTPATSIILGKVLLGAGLIALFLCLVIGFATASGERCAKCGKRLQGIAAQIAVATGNCGYCGERAFDTQDNKKPD